MNIRRATQYKEARVLGRYSIQKLISLEERGSQDEAQKWESLEVELVNVYPRVKKKITATRQE